MAKAIDLSGLTLNAEEAQDLSMVVFEKTLLEKSAITSTASIETGVQMKQQIVILGKLGLVGKKSGATCDRNEETGAAASEKFWDPILMEWSLVQCAKDIPQLFKLWKRAAKASDTWAEIDSEELAYLEDIAVEGNIAMILRVAWLSDPTNTADGAGSGNELLTAGTDADYFNPIKGIFNQLETSVAAGDTPRVTISENAQATEAAQLTLASGQTLKYLRAAWLKASTALKAQRGKDAFIALTSELYVNYTETLEDKGFNFTLDEVRDGVSKMAFRGVPVVERPDLSENIAAYFSDGTKLYNPNRLVFSTLGNVRIATSAEEDMDTLTSLYGVESRKHYFDSALYLDAKVVEDNMVVYGY